MALQIITSLNTSETKVKLRPVLSKTLGAVLMLAALTGCDPKEEGGQVAKKDPIKYPTNKYNFPLLNINSELNCASNLQTTELVKQNHAVVIDNSQKSKDIDEQIIQIIKKAQLYAVKGDVENAKISLSLASENAQQIGVVYTDSQNRWIESIRKVIEK